MGPPDEPEKMSQWVTFDALAEAITPEQLARVIGAEKAGKGWRCHPHGEPHRQVKPRRSRSTKESRMLNPSEELADLVRQALEGPLKGKISIHNLVESKRNSSLHPDSPYSNPLIAAAVMTELVILGLEGDRLLFGIMGCLDTDSSREANSSSPPHVVSADPQESAVEPTLEES
jgi:hypothetical protein